MSGLKVIFFKKALFLKMRPDMHVRFARLLYVIVRAARSAPLQSESGTENRGGVRSGIVSV